MTNLRSICVFCGSSPGRSPAYLEAARTLGEVLARSRLRLVYGGASVGLMGAVADSALAHGGEAVGVIPRGLADRELAHPGLTELRVVSSMHERKAQMEALSDAFVALPGGFGTFEEFCEILTWAQLGLHHKPFGLLNIEAYYDPFIRFVDHAVHEGFVRAHHRAMLLVATESQELLSQFATYQPPHVEASKVKV